MSTRDLATLYFHDGVKLVGNATAIEKSGQYENAKKLYGQAKMKMELVLQKTAADPSNKMRAPAEQYAQQCQQKIDMLNNIQTDAPVVQSPSGAAQQSRPNKPEGGAPAKKSGGGGKGGNDDEKEKDEFMNRMEGAILVEKPDVKWSDVAGLAEAKRALNEAVILPLQFRQFFVGERAPWRGILLYGPPGTGKSYLAKATATESGNSTFLTVSTSDLVSKWLGESEKLIRALFDMARKKTPAIIFIDEIDSLLSERSENDSESARRIKTEFLIQMDGVGKSMDGILILAATNIPWGLDPAVRRRFEKKIYIPLPEVESRATLLDIKLKKTPNNVTDAQKKQIAEMTEGYSGADLKILVREAAMLTIRKLQNAEYFKEYQGQYYAVGANEPGAIKSKLTDLPKDKVAVPPVTYEDFRESILKIRPSVSPGDLTRFEQWTSEFGQEGN